MEEDKGALDGTLPSRGSFLELFGFSGFSCGEGGWGNELKDGLSSVSLKRGVVSCHGVLRGLSGSWDLYSKSDLVGAPSNLIAVVLLKPGWHELTYLLRTLGLALGDLGMRGFGRYEITRANHRETQTVDAEPLDIQVLALNSKRKGHDSVIVASVTPETLKSKSPGKSINGDTRPKTSCCSHCSSCSAILSRTKRPKAFHPRP